MKMLITWKPQQVQFYMSILRYSKDQADSENLVADLREYRKCLYIHKSLFLEKFKWALLNLICLKVFSICG